MSSFDLEASMARAERRRHHSAWAGPRPRRRRSDAGSSRVAPPVEAHLRRLLLGWSRPPVEQLQRELRAHCGRLGLPCLSRATLYAVMARVSGHSYSAADLPDEARSALYNLSDAAIVPGHQLAFYLFNYGDVRALQFAAGLPWLDLYQADRLRGWRPKSHGLLRAVMRARGI